MPAYSYEALDSTGRVLRGALEADSAKAARSLLRAQALVPLQVSTIQAGAAAPGASTTWWDRLRARRVLSPGELTVWTRQLAGLVGAGLPLERALGALTDEVQNVALRDLMARLRAEVNGGATFASALGLYPQEFAQTYVAVVAAGEQSGQLDAVLLALADELEQQQELKAKLISASVYPAIVTGVAIVIVLFLVSYVVPQVATVFVSTKRSLPWLTQAMLALSGFVKSYGWLVLLALGLALLGARWALRNDAVRQRFDARWLNLPLIGAMARSYNAAQFSSTLALLAGAGVPILRALQAAAQTLNNRAMRADALDALVLVREGAPLALALAQKKRFPALISTFARLGEQTGQLPLMLQRVARQIGADVQRRALRLATILEPLLVVGMGVTVMLIVLAVLLPIIQLNQWVK